MGKSLQVQPHITKARAMAICEQIRTGVGEIANLLAELHADQGWTLLGYLTWKECCKKEFHHSAWWGKQQLKIADVRKALPPPPKRVVVSGAIAHESTPHSDSHLIELAKVPTDRRQAVLDWATEKADGKPLTAAAIRAAAKELAEAEPEDDTPQPIQAIRAAAANGKIKATDKQLEALADFDEETQEALLASILAGRQTVANAIETGCPPDPTMEEIIREQASGIEHACRAIMNVVQEEVAKLTDPWMDDLNRREGAMQKFKDGCETLRSCKCVAACPKCDGGGCAKCHKTGRVTRYTLQQLT